MEGNPFSYLKCVTFGGLTLKRCNPHKEPLECSIPVASQGQLDIQLEFQGHYGEPSLSLPLSLTGHGESEV